MHNYNELKTTPLMSNPRAATSVAMRTCTTKHVSQGRYIEPVFNPLQYMHFRSMHILMQVNLHCLVPPTFKPIEGFFALPLVLVFGFRWRLGKFSCSAAST